MTDQRRIEDLARELVMSYPPEAIRRASEMIEAGPDEWDEYLDAHYAHEEATCH